MKFKEWNEIAELIGIAAIVGSLIFVGLQMKQAQDIANAERRMMVVDAQIELRNAINNFAEVWAKGSANDDLEGHEAVIFRNIVANLNDFAFARSAAARYLGSLAGEQGAIADFALILHENPGARDMFKFLEGEYVRIAPDLAPAHDPPEAWMDTVESALAKLDRLQEL